MKKISVLLIFCFCSMIIVCLTGCNSSKTSIPNRYIGTYTDPVVGNVVVVRANDAKISNFFCYNIKIGGITYANAIVGTNNYYSFDYYDDNTFSFSGKSFDYYTVTDVSGSSNINFNGKLSTSGDYEKITAYGSTATKY